MYRIVDKTEDRANLNIHEDEIPDDVKTDVALGEIETQQVRVQEDKKSQRMQLKVVYKPKEVEPATDADAELTQRVYYVDRQEDTY